MSSLFFSFFYCSSRGGRLFRTAEWAGCGDRRCRRRGGGGGGGRGQTCGLSRQGIVAGIFFPPFFFFWGTEALVRARRVWGLGVV